MPLQDAIKFGVTSCEADVWYEPDSGDHTIYVSLELYASTMEKLIAIIGRT